MRHALEAKILAAVRERGAVAGREDRRIGRAALGVDLDSVADRQSCRCGKAGFRNDPNANDDEIRLQPVIVVGLSCDGTAVADQPLQSGSFDQPDAVLVVLLSQKRRRRAGECEGLLR